MNDVVLLLMPMRFLLRSFWAVELLNVSLLSPPVAVSMLITQMNTNILSVTPVMEVTVDWMSERR